MMLLPHGQTGANLGPEFQPAITLLVNAIVGKHGAPAPLAEAEATIEAMRPPIETLYPVAAQSGVYKLIADAALTRIVVDIDPPIRLAPAFTPWFDNAVKSGQVKLDRWYSYKQFLTHDKHFGPQVLDQLDQSSSEVVDLLGDPSEPGSWKRRGLVIGDVQSGKTATYIGIVNKAADAGFKLVVLLTGGTESLRKQTQYRIDEGFLGKDSKVSKVAHSAPGQSHEKIIGVGNFPTESQFLRGQGMTSHAKDFVGAVLEGQGINIDPNADHPYVFVLKKNKVPLNNLITWLKGQFAGEHFDIPMLVVDDESDYASVNTNYKASGDTSPTLINQKIRELLSLASRSSYMAFTATPFANVFIDHKSFDEALKDDLFPHHYIYALSSPSNYVGAKQYFGSSSASVNSGVVDITDAQDVFIPKHKSHLVVAQLPASLVDAVYAFVIASAIRLTRGDESARSMLVNVSRFKNVQGQVHELVSEEFARIKSAIEIHASPPVVGEDKHEVLRRLAEVHADYFPDAKSDWPSVRNKLLAAVFDTSVELINSSRDKQSDDKSRNMIAVGGDVLSRGLTLDGLTVSYFYRLVGAADTLLQMARWFGYRPGYADLTRVWITPDVADQFRFVSDVIEELRDQILEMRDLGKTPEDFGLMVRKHPETLAITAKRGAGQTYSVVISLAGRRIESTKIPASSKVLAGNDSAVRSFLTAIESDDPTGSWDPVGLKYKGRLNVTRERVADLLEAFKFDRGNLILANALHKIIRGQTAPAFQDWTVCLATGAGDSLELTPSLKLASTPSRTVRYAPDGTQGSFRVSGSSARLAGSTDLAGTYGHADRPDLMEPAVYADLPHPTLLIYPLTPKFGFNLTDPTPLENRSAAEQEAAAKAAWKQAEAVGVSHLMALKIAIPGAQGAQSGDVKYMLNGPAVDAFVADFGVDDDDEEDLDE